MIEADFGDFLLFNVYFPNGGMNETRLAYKLEFNKQFLAYVKKLLKQGKRVVICGDVNTAHTEMDIARPKENEKHSGFMPVEREWFDRFLAAGLVDTFRFLHPDQREAYTWWDQRFRARDRNIGWRIDYFLISENLKKHLRSAQIHADVMGSDHCPISITLA
jgi:exodeoxyribonuclease-3